MRIKNISLKNYRNIETADIDFADGINILAGENANGKTNAVEAVYQFAQGKSFRTKNNVEAIGFDKDMCELSIVFVSDKSDKSERNIGMNIKFNRDKSKKFYYNGVQTRKIIDFIGNFRAVLFTPDHLGLVKGNPETRRKFIDMAISQIKPVYLSYLIDCNRTLIQRNHLLKHIKQTGETDEKLEQLIYGRRILRDTRLLYQDTGENI